MARCDTCGNDYEPALQITWRERRHTFDSFECAIQMLASTCEPCGCRIIGHGVQPTPPDGRYFCSGHCAGRMGIRDMNA